MEFEEEFTEVQARKKRGESRHLKGNNSKKKKAKQKIRTWQVKETTIDSPKKKPPSRQTDTLIHKYTGTQDTQQSGHKDNEKLYIIVTYSWRGKVEKKIPEMKNITIVELTDEYDEDTRYILVNEERYMCLVRR